MNFKKFLKFYNIFHIRLYLNSAILILYHKNQDGKLNKC